MRALAIVTVLAAACGGTESKPSSGPAGEVIRVEGRVSATRDGAQRTLGVGDAVAAADTIVTMPDSSVDIRLVHNGAVWKLGPDESRRVDQSAAWRAPKGSTDESAFANTDPDRTASAGRHTDMAFDEGAMATKAEEGEQLGTGGYGLKGSGPGGGGSGYGAGSGGKRGGTGSKLRVAMGTATVHGPLDKDVIRRVMRSRYPALRRCYEHELEKNPKFAIELRVLFTVETSGRLSPITVDPEPTPTFTSCLKGAIRAVHMPEADAETDVALPLTFAQ